MDQSLKAAYGSYAIPEEIKLLLQLEQEFMRDGKTMGFIGLRPSLTYDAYSITPPDLIPFADTGGDGIHFGFLTDFGLVESLESAPIVCVSPTNDPPIRLLAKNIRDFLDMASSVPYVENLEEWWGCQDEAKMIAQQEEWEKDTPFHVQKERNEMFARFQKTLGTKPTSVYSSIQEARREREHQIALPTLDGLGIIGSRRKGQPFEFRQDRFLDESEMARMRSFLATACLEEKLAFVRDAMFWYIVSKDYDVSMAELLLDLFHSLGLRDEAARMNLYLSLP